MTEGTRHPKANKRSPEQKADDEAFIASMRLRGHSFRHIAAALNSRGRDYTLSVQQVRNDVVRVRATWQQQAVDAIAESHAEMLAELREIRREAWAIFEASKTPRTIKKAEKTNLGPNGGPSGRDFTKSSVVSEERHGDLDALRLVLDVQERQAKLLGIDLAPKGVADGPQAAIGTATITFVVSHPEVEALDWNERVKAVTGRDITPGPAVLNG